MSLLAKGLKNTDWENYIFNINLERALSATRILDDTYQRCSTSGNFKIRIYSHPKENDCKKFSKINTEIGLFFFGEGDL